MPRPATDATRVRLVRAMLNERPETWTLLSGHLDDLDALDEFERTALPLLTARWVAEGRDLDRFPLLRGMRRRMVVRNRLLVQGARAALTTLRGVGIQALPLKGAALIARVLPESGMRPLADVDLWVRPSDHPAALQALARGGSERGGRRATRDPHARMLRVAFGRELDVHHLPSELFARRGYSDDDAEALFARTWARSTKGQPALADAIHLSFVNALFSHAPGEPRAAFALIELDTVLRHPDVTDATLRSVTADAIEDRTAMVLVEHLDWLGPGASEPLDRLLRDHLTPALGAEDLRLRDWLARSRRASEHAGSLADGSPEATFFRRVRQLAHARTAVPNGTLAIARWLARAEAQNVRRRPIASITAIARRRAWRRVGGLIRSTLLSARAAR